MEIVHDEAKKQFKVEVDGYTAHHTIMHAANVLNLLLHALML